MDRHTKIIRKRRTDKTPYWFLMPVALLMAAFALYPILNVFYYSFQHYNPGRPAKNGFAGLENYIRIFTEDEMFWRALVTSVKWVAVVVLGQFLIGLAMALLLNMDFRARWLARAAIFAPWALSGVVIAILWSLIYNQNIGVLNDLLDRVGFSRERIAWTANPATAFGAAAVAEIWAGIPFFTISLLAQLQSIPKELYESCAIDGGGGIKQFRYVTLPYLKGAITLNCLVRCVWEFNSVDLILNLTGGGPVGLTTTLSIYLTNQAIETRNFGYGSAIGTVAFLMMLAFSIGYLRVNRYEEGEP